MREIILYVFHYLNKFWLGFVCGGIFSTLFLVSAIAIAKDLTTDWKYPPSLDEWKKSTKE